MEFIDLSSVDMKTRKPTWSGREQRKLGLGSEILKSEYRAQGDALGQCPLNSIAQLQSNWVVSVASGL